MRVKALVSYTISHDDYPQWEKILECSERMLRTTLEKYQDSKLPNRYYIENDTGYLYIKILEEIDFKTLEQEYLS